MPVRERVAGQFGASIIESGKIEGQDAHGLARGRRALSPEDILLESLFACVLGRLDSQLQETGELHQPFRAG
jgi:hypothetical protein